MSFALEDGIHRHGICHRGAVALACACLAACQSNAVEKDQATNGVTVLPPSAGAAAGWSAPPVAGAASPVAIAGSGGGAAGNAGVTSSGAGGTAGAAGAAGMHDHPVSTDHCVDGFPPDATDAQLTGEPDEFVAGNGDIDLPLPAAVLKWMDDRVWKQSHDAWHNVRRCESFFPGMGGSNICMEHAELVAEHAECSDAEDGYQFLVMHRHMMQGLKQAFPQHTELFEGFPEFPFEAQDVPEQWRDRWSNGWSAQIQEVAHTLEDIENRLSDFPTEGDLGQFIQCGGMGGFGAASSIHGAMHFKWVVMSSPNSLGNQAVNIGNYMFWKLHGWIDNIWERYRTAKGLAPAEPKLVQALVDQCREMHELGLVFDPTLANQPGAPLPEETGFFHENVRPILEENCASCHGGSTPMAGLLLGGAISSAEIVAQLVDVPTMRGGQFKRVVAGAPDQSWLYLKVSDTAKSAGCSGTCSTQSMPPTGRIELTTAELGLVRQWIEDGALAPTPAP